MSMNVEDTVCFYRAAKKNRLGIWRETLDDVFKPGFNGFVDDHAEGAFLIVFGQQDH